MARKQKIGTVVSDKMQDSVVVEIESFKRHPLYKKLIKRTRRMVVDAKEVPAKIGSKVVIEESRPISRTKSWKVTEVLNKG